MAQHTEIAWCDSTFNPWIGCQKVGPSCDNCYAEREFDHRHHRAKWGPGQERVRTSPANWANPLRWHRTAPAFIEAHGRRPRVFCASLADVFDAAVPDQWRRDLFDLILATPNLDWLLLTKRIGNVKKMLNEVSVCRGALLTANDEYRPPDNLWIGATICNQEEADRDIPKLLAVPARVRFVSMEPLLGPVRLNLATACDRQCSEFQNAECPGSRGLCAMQNALDWVIVGGESGPNARPMHPEWVRSLRDQCSAAGVPFLFKQWGEWTEEDPGEGPHSDCAGILPNGDVAKYSEGYVAPWDTHKRLKQAGGVRLDGRTLVFRVGKKAAGRLLDGKLHDEFPRLP